MILAYLESNSSQLPKSALVTIAAALEAKKTHLYSKAIGLLVGGNGVEQAAAEAAKHGLDEVVYIQADFLEPYLALNHAAAIAAAVESLQPSLVIAAATTQGKDVSPRVAFAMDAGQASDVIGFLPDGKFKRLMYAGNIVAEVELTTEKRVATVRLTAFEAAPSSGSSSPVRKIDYSGSPDDRQKFVAFDSVKSERPELTEAGIVVSGGRALKSAESFLEVIGPLADVLGAAIGASRAAVDSGYAPNDWQVGQTGKVVAPALYVAIGISGAIQHLAGMKDSKVIVAINKDAEAPIFEVADYGLVADLFTVVPELTAEVKKLKGGA